MPTSASEGSGPGIKLCPYQPTKDDQISKATRQADYELVEDGKMSQSLPDYLSTADPAKTMIQLGFGRDKVHPERISMQILSTYLLPL
jgi:hypothetical protein